ncbi:transcription factor bHLH143-like [Neltuma alba]|uniref:transcription factor bHLH143-like n=1 Tax=Neltuma alba TaxID=207710 RepID=UPI0010A460BC|nr:transcription factor bHLH143-like [Prosopis alba]
MVKADSSWPCPQNVAWQAHHLNCSPTSREPRLCGLPADLNTSMCNFPGHKAFPGFTFPGFLNLGTVQTEELRGFLQYPNHHHSGDIQSVSEQCLKESDIGGAMPHENPASLQKKFLIFDQSGDKTRLFYSPIFPLVHSPNVAPSKFIQASGETKMGQAASTDENYPMKYSLPEDRNENHINVEESELHEDTEEINALLYSDEDVDYHSDDDEVASTGCSPLATKRPCVMQDQFENMKEEVASSDQPTKRQKLNDDGLERSSPINSGISVRQDESCDYTSDAESKNSTSQVYSAKQTRGEENSMMGNTHFKKDKIRESLKVLENLVPGAKGKEPLSVIDGTIEYLKSLMSRSGTPGFGLKDY